MSNGENLAGQFTFPGTELKVHRMGFGAMQLAGPHVFGPPRDRAACVRVLRRVIEAGVDHLDTSDFYGPHITNQIIHEALHPYPKNLVIVSKLGARRGAAGEWIHDLTPECLTNGLHDNLRHLSLDAIDIVNLRCPGFASATPGFDPRPAMAVLAGLQQQGKIKHIGLSNVDAEQIRLAEEVAPVVCVQNAYNLANRADDALVQALATRGIAYVPFFPLGGFTPLQSTHLNEVAESLGATPMQVALAWLLQRSPKLLLIPGTSSLAHLEENLAAARLRLPESALRTLDAVGSAA
ncbi:MAG: oxidoreductase [Acidobacteriota bacterium]|nr:oxidoreductase [Acidobacteriota bacterium]